MPAVAIKDQNLNVKEEVVNVNPFPLEGEMIDGKWCGKWKIHDPRTVKYVERTDFLKSICGHIDHEDTLEDLIARLPNTAFNTAKFELQDLAHTYIVFRNKGARLPKFSRWVTGMFSGNKEFAKIMADEGQKAAKRKIIMSVDLVDILRNAATPHFRSCFDLGGTYSAYAHMPKKIAEECPGIGIVYVDDEDGMMMGRHWMHHAKIKDTGEDMIVLTQSQYGCLEGRNLARLLANKGIKVGIGAYYDNDIASAAAVYVDYVGCFNVNVHHDLRTWAPSNKGHKVELVRPAFTK